MTRSVLFGLAAFFLLTLLAFWLTSPNRKGPSELEKDFAPPTQGMKQGILRVENRPSQTTLDNSQVFEEEPELVGQISQDYDNPQGLAIAKGAGKRAEAEEQEALMQERVDTLEEQHNEKRLEAVQQLWYYAADHGVPEESLEALYDLAMDPDQEIAETALAALEDLWGLQEKAETEPVMPEYDNPDDPAGLNLVTEELEVTEEWTTQALDAVQEKDEDRREDAVGAVALGRHSDAVTVLADVASFDSSPEIRYRALEALWYAAADGLDADGHIKATLEEAVSDPDPDVSALAKRALEDLETLE